MKSLRDYIIDDMRKAEEAEYLFEMANAVQEDTGLQMNVWIDEPTKGRGGHNEMRLKFQLDKSSTVHSDNLGSLIISRDPYIPPSQNIDLKGIGNEAFNELKRWVRGNRTVLTLCWQRKMSQRQALQALRNLADITDEILEKEDKTDVSRVDPGYYISLKHLNRVPSTLEELMEIVYSEIETKGIECTLNHIDTSHITNMSGLFDGVDFNGDISSWDVSNVRNMSCIFKESSFDGNISNWDVRNVRNMTCMFMNSEFAGDISGWHIDPKCCIFGMFEGCGIPEENKPSWEFA